jgi:hypothetical protein
VRQRNDTPHAWSFAATPATDDTPEHPPFAVGPGDIVDHPVLLDGWTEVEDDPAPPPVNDAPAKTPSRTKRAAAADTDKDGGEPQ